MHLKHSISKTTADFNQIW